MFRFGDIFRSSFFPINKKSDLEEKISNTDLPLEEFLKDDEAISTTKFMGKNVQKYLNSEKIKKLIKLITEEPVNDDHLRGHKYPYVASEILKLDCPFIAKRFVLNEQEYDEEYPESPDDDNDNNTDNDDIEQNNELNEIEFDFKKKKTEFEKIYSQIEESFRNLKNSVNADKKEKRSKDDDYKDEYKFEEEEHYDENEKNIKDDNGNNNDKEENAMDDINLELDDEEQNNINNDEKKENNDNNIDKNNNNEDNKDNNNIDINEDNNMNIYANESIKDKNDETNEKNDMEKKEEKKENNENTTNENEIKEENKKENDGNKNEENIDQEKNNDINEIQENKEENKKQDTQENLEKKEELIKTDIKEEKKENKKEEDNIKIENEDKKDENKEKIEEDINLNNKEEEIKEEKQDEVKEANQEEIQEVNQNEVKKDNQENEKDIINEDIKSEKNEEIKKETNEPQDIENHENNHNNNNEIPEQNPEKNEEDKTQNEVQNKSISSSSDVNPINKEEKDQEEEINNIIVDKNDEDKQNIKSIENIENDNEENSLSVEGELEEIPKQTKKKKKVYKNTNNNQYLDLLLNFVMTDKAELNYVLSGYFANVLLILLNKYPYRILKYLYTQRRDAIKKIILHSNQKAFAIVSTKLLNIESYITPGKETQNDINELILQNINYRNELIKEVLNSISLEGLIDTSTNAIKQGIDVEGIFSLIIDLIKDNNNIAKELLYGEGNYLSPYLFDILDTNLYDDNINNSDNFNTKYMIYGFFINLTSKLIKIINTQYTSLLPTNFDYNCISKPKNERGFNNNLILSFGKILKNNYLAKKPALILEKMSSICYKGLGALNIHILELVINMFSFMKELPNQYDLLLIRNNFCKNSIEFFFKYQWNDLYLNKFVNFFNLYLENEEKHGELTNFFFENMKLQNLLTNYLEEKELNNNAIFQKIKFEFKSGNKIKSGIYPHVIDLVYKIHALSGLDFLTVKEISDLAIKNIGEFEFIKDETSNKLIKLIKTSDNLKNILSKDENWTSMIKNIALPMVKKYEGKLCKLEKKLSDEDDLFDTKNDYGSNGLLLQQMLNVLKKSNPLKRFSAPLSRNDNKGSGMNNIGNKAKNIKISIREKLLNKGYKSKPIFDDDEDDNKNEKNIDDKNENSEETNDSYDNNEISNDKDKAYYDSNYWELKNELPEKIKKEVDKKTNIIFNYNPITGENEKKNEISEEDELLSVAMGLEQNEKMEKNKKIMYIMPGRLKPINLKTKSNPVQNFFFKIPTGKNNEFDKLKNKKKDIVIFDMDNEKEKEEEEENIINDEDNKKEDDINMNLEEEIVNKNIEEEDNNKKDDDENKMFNDVNFWKTKQNYLNEKEMDDLINEL